MPHTWYDSDALLYYKSKDLKFNLLKNREFSEILSVHTPNADNVSAAIKPKEMMDKKLILIFKSINY